MLAGLCSYRDIVESRVDFCDLAVMNELLDVQQINQRRWLEHERNRPEEPMTQALPLHGSLG